MSAPVWTVDGVALPRNPDTYEIKWDKANVTYQVQADGSQVRVGAPKLTAGADVTLTWANADRRLLNAIMPFFNSRSPAASNVHKITMDGIQPPQQMYAYFDTPQRTMSKEVYTTKAGEGGVRHDLNLTLRMAQPYFRSLNTIPMTVPTSAQVASWFGGPIGNGVDGVPVWNGSGWNPAITASTTAISIDNLGTAPWSPKIRINGPFNAVTLTQTYADVDGTGAGCAFQWTGSAVAAGDYLLFDTAAKRCWHAVSGVLSEVYTFKVYTVSDGLPFMYWPPMNPGLNAQSVSMAGFVGASTSVDFSNHGAETFGYW